MGDRANYALRRPGSRRVDVRLARFGAPFLFGDVFWGPEHAQAFIEAQEKGPWLDDVYGEAAIAMCLQKKRVALYSYQLGRFAAAIAVRLMQPLWPGWEIQFVTRLSEVTPAVGYDLVGAWVRKARKGAAKQLEYHRRRDPLAALGRELTARWYDPLLRGLVTHVTPAGPVDHLLDVDAPAALFAGPALLDALPRAVTLTAAERGLRARRKAWDLASPADLFVRYGCGPHVVIDPARRRLVLSVEEGLEESAAFANAHAIGSAWPGWELVVQRGGAPAHFAATSRTVPELLRGAQAPEPPPDDDERLTLASLRHLRGLLFDADARKAEAEAFLGRASAAITSIVEDAVGRGATVERGGGADLVTPKGQLSLEERRRSWERAVREAGLEAAAERALGPAPEAVEPTTRSPDERFHQAHLAFKHGSGRVEARALLEGLLVDDPRHTRALGLLGRIAYLDGHDDEARRWSEAAVALDPEDFEPWATLGLVSGRAKDRAQQVRYNSRAFECAPHPWIVDNLTCACLDHAEVLPPGDERCALLQRALDLATSTIPPTPFSRWSEACALSLLERDADRAWAALGEAVRLERREPAQLLAKLKADPQLAWVWRAKEGETLA